MTASDKQGRSTQGESCNNAMQMVTEIGGLYVVYNQALTAREGRCFILIHSKMFSVEIPIRGHIDALFRR